jgi:beta-glucosidase-like glycosyl hydrolase/CubicO group peptidase (beta-lactamase class C family)
VDAEARRWVDSALASLDTRALAAQLVFPWMWGRYIPADGDEGRTLAAWVDAGVGGIITSIGPPVALADKLNRLQRRADLPLLIAADLENGPGMRIQGGTALPYGVDMGGGTTFPPVMALGAAGDPGLAYAMGRVTAAEARAVGIHLNFAPVVDVNNNPANPIINTRSYGGDPAAVSELAAAQVRGLQANGLLATAKHFPGHGDVEHDTHLVPLILRIDATRADTVELVPYRAVIEAGVSGVMSAHIAFPALGDSTLPATLSARMLDSLLVGELGFGGLIVTDALNMGAIVQRFGAGDAAVRALEAGADILLQPRDPFVVIDAVVAAVEEGRLTRARLARSARKLLEAKARVGLHRERTVDVSRVADVVGAPGHAAVAERAAERSITLVRDRDGLVPLVPLRDRRTLLLTYTDHIAPFAGRALAAELRRELPRLARVALGPEPPHPVALDSLVARADSADLVIVAVDSRVGAGTGALDSATTDAVRRIAAARPTVLVSLGNPYLLGAIPEVGTYLLGWSGADVSQTAVARALLGRAPVAGALPIAIPPLHGRGDGIGRDAVRPGLAAPVAYGHVGGVGPIEGAEPAPVDRLDGAALDSLSRTVRAAIAAGVTPGAAVAVGTSRGGAWIQGFGHTDWGGDVPVVTHATLYDLASLTKVVGTTSAIMRLVDAGRLSLDAPLARYLPAWPAGGWRDSVTIRRLLTHTAGLPPFVRFWHPSEGGLRGTEAFIEAIAALDSARAPAGYRYSDLGFILLGATVEAVADTTLEGFLDAELWTPLGMDDTGFNPLDVMTALDRIAPTEVDTVLRHVHVHGEVHDENAWAMGGVAGHAGLFSTAHDLARFAHTLLRSGRAGDRRVLGPDGVAAFAARQPGMQRGLGWDARDSVAVELDRSPDVPGDTAGARDAPAYDGIDAPFSPSAFGHTGFTGTSLWVDPARDLYVILLTNRVNPTRAQDGITELRRAVHEWAVKAVER